MNKAAVALQMQGAALWGVSITAIGGIGGTLAGATASLNSPQSSNQNQPLLGCGLGTAFAAIIAVVLIIQRAQSTR